MERVLIIILSILYSCAASASALYQIDLILFAHPNQKPELTRDTPLIPMQSEAIFLKAAQINQQNLIIYCPLHVPVFVMNTIF